MEEWAAGGFTEGARRVASTRAYYRRLGAAEGREFLVGGVLGGDRYNVEPMERGQGSARLARATIDGLQRERQKRSEQPSSNTSSWLGLQSEAVAAEICGVRRNRCRHF